MALPNTDTDTSYVHPFAEAAPRPHSLTCAPLPPPAARPRAPPAHSHTPLTHSSARPLTRTPYSLTRTPHPLTRAPLAHSSARHLLTRGAHHSLTRAPLPRSLVRPTRHSHAPLAHSRTPLVTRAPHSSLARHTRPLACCTRTLLRLFILRHFKPGQLTFTSTNCS